MAPDNYPVLFPARPSEGMLRPQQRQSSGTKSIVAQLVQTMAATLGAADALPRLTEVIGSQLGADACLLLRYQRQTRHLFYSFWQPGASAKCWMLSAGPGSPHGELTERIAQSLIHGGTDQPQEANSLPWREGIQALLQDSQPSWDWLSQVHTCNAIGVTTAPDMDGVVLLLHGPTQRSIWLSQAQELELAGLVAIAFHQHHLQHQAQRSNEQLTYLSYLKEDFLSTLNHELRTPLTSMMLAIRMLRRPDLTPERAAMYLDILEQQCSREINLVNDLLMLQTVDAKQPKTSLVPTDLVQLLTELGEREQHQFARAKLKLALELPNRPVMMATSRDYLTRILQELLTNARKYANSGSTVTLQLLNNLASNQSIKLRLTNTGAGIQPEEIPHIFEKFRRGQNATKNAIPGTGTGLALVKGLVEQLSGAIAVTSQPTTRHIWQTCFTIELPIPNEKTKCA